MDDTSFKSTPRRGTDEESFNVPLAKADELFPLDASATTVPGQPLIPLDDHGSVLQFLARELSTERLSRFYALLFMTSNPRNTNPLHHQRVKMRDVCVTERPDMHLLWYYGRIFIKPIPACLFSHDFLTTYVYRSETGAGYSHLALEVNGFLRSYSRLIVHESDFDLARDLKLIPRSVTWERWSFFIQGFQTVRDAAVARRHHYGEIRLTRLNFCVALLTGRSFVEMNLNYAVYFSRFGPPYLLLFGVFSVLLTALQAGLAIYTEDGNIYHRVSIAFVPFASLTTLVAVLLLPMQFAFLVLKELFFYFYDYKHSS